MNAEKDLRTYDKCAVYNIVVCLWFLTGIPHWIHNGSMDRYDWQGGGGNLDMGGWNTSKQRPVRSAYGPISYECIVYFITYLFAVIWHTDVAFTFCWFIGGWCKWPGNIFKIQPWNLPVHTSHIEMHNNSLYDRPDTTPEVTYLWIWESLM